MPFPEATDRQVTPNVCPHEDCNHQDSQHFRFNKNTVTFLEEVGISYKTIGREALKVGVPIDQIPKIKYLRKQNGQQKGLGGGQNACRYLQESTGPSESVRSPLSTPSWWDTTDASLPIWKD